MAIRAEDMMRLVHGRATWAGQHSASAIAAMLAVGIAGSLIHLTGVLVNWKRGAVPVSAAQSAVPRASGMESVVAAHLFGAAPVSAVGPPRDLKLAVFGTIAYFDPALGFAILGEDHASARMYRVGSIIGEAYTLTGVYPDHVVIVRDGVSSSIFLPRSNLFGLGMNLPQGVSADDSNQVAPPTEQMPEHDPVFQMINGRWTFGGINPLPRIKGGRVVDMILHPTDDPKSVARQAGVRDGDVVTQINRQPLPNVADLAAYLRGLEGQGQSELTVMRAGKAVTLHVLLPKEDHSNEE